MKPTGVHRPLPPREPARREADELRVVYTLHGCGWFYQEKCSNSGLQTNRCAGPGDPGWAVPQRDKNSPARSASAWTQRKLGLERQADLLIFDRPTRTHRRDGKSPTDRRAPSFITGNEIAALLTLQARSRQALPASPIVITRKYAGRKSRHRATVARDSRASAGLKCRADAPMAPRGDGAVR